MMYAATPDAPKSRHLCFVTLASFFVPSASKRPSLGFKAVDWPHICPSFAKDRAAWTAFSARCLLGPGKSKEKYREGEITRRMRKLSHFGGKAACVKRSHTYIKYQFDTQYLNCCAAFEKMVYLRLGLRGVQLICSVLTLVFAAVGFDGGTTS